MKNNYFIKRNKKSIIVLMLLFCGLFTNTVMAQDTFTWNGSSSNDWATAANWDVARNVTTPGTDTYPSQTRTIDIVAITNGGTPAVASPGSYTISKLTISNLTGPESGSVLTINSGAAITVTSSLAGMISLAGGNIINNGTLTSNTTLANLASFGMNCNTPSVIPTIPRVYGYSGTGALNIIRASSTNANSGGIQFGGIAANTTYKFSFDGTTTFTIPNSVVSPGLYVIRMSQSSTIPVIISGAGFTVNDNFGLIYQFGNGTSLTIDQGTTLTWNKSAAASLAYGMYIVQNFATSGSPLNFVNKGTININGDLTKSGIYIAATNNCNCNSIVNFENQGAINVNISSTESSTAALQIAGGINGRSLLNIKNTSTGTMNLKNTQPNAANIGRAFQNPTSANGPYVSFTNDGILNFTGSNTNFGGQLETFLNNNGTISSNYGFDLMVINNNTNGAINFTNAATTFTVDISAAATAGDTYTDANSNVYTVTTTKVNGIGTQLLTSLTTAVAATVKAGTVAIPADLTLSSGTGDAIINYTGINAATAAIPSTAQLNNNGILNAGKGRGASLSTITGISDPATGTISPGGSSGKGIANFSKLSATLSGKLILQIAGNTASGVDFDQIQNTLNLGSFTIAPTAILDVTGIYTPSAAVTIDAVTSKTLSSHGTITGTFSSVIGLTTGWSVNYIVGTTGVAGKVQLVFDPALGIAQSSKFKFNVYPNPATDVLNLSAEKNIDKVELFNLVGQKVLSNTVNAVQKQFDISNLQKGIYLMEVTIENAKETYKIIKK